MLFNQNAPFNRSAFNRQISGTSAVLTGATTWKWGVQSSQPLKTNVPIRGTTSLTYGITGNAILYIDFGTISSSITLDAATSERLRSTLNCEGVTGITFSVEGQLINSHAYSITLTGLNLQQGGTVIIDTDTLDIFVNGVLNVMCWQSGGEFFNLAAGDNNIQVYTDGNGAGEFTVQWKDRWY